MAFKPTPKPLALDDNNDDDMITISIYKHNWKKTEKIGKVRKEHSKYANNRCKYDII